MERTELKMNQKFVRTANKYLKGLLMGVVYYAIGISAIQAIDMLNPKNERITYKEQLDVVVKEEASKLGLDASKIDVKYGAKKTRTRKYNGRTELEMRAGLGCRRNTVKHELYHILKDWDKEHNYFHYLFIEEPRATAYEVFGWKI